MVLSLNNICLCKRRPTSFPGANLICLAVVSRDFMANGNQEFSSLLRPMLKGIIMQHCISSLIPTCGTHYRLVRSPA